MKVYSALACALALCAPTVNAAELYGQYGYVGASAVFSNTRDEVADESETSPGGSISAGYFFLPFLGVEASYGYDDELFGDEDYERADLQLLTRYELSDYAELYAGVGASYLITDEIQSDGSNVDIFGSFGVRYSMTDNAALNVGYKFYDDPGMWDHSVSSLSVGVDYNFGEIEPPAIVLDPVIVDDAPIVVTLTTQSAETLYAVDAYQLTQGSRDALVPVIEDLKDPSTTASIVGHTDSTGSEEYNQKLSEKRAQYVKDYMVSQGVNPQQLTAEGRGETDPIAENDTRVGRSKNRRVEVIYYL